MCAIILSIIIDILNTGQKSVSGKDVVIQQEVCDCLRGDGIPAALLRAAARTDMARAEGGRNVFDTGLLQRESRFEGGGRDAVEDDLKGTR